MSLKVVETIYSMNATDVIGCLKQFVEEWEKEIEEGEVVTKSIILIKTDDHGRPFTWTWGVTSELEDMAILGLALYDLKHSYMVRRDDCIPDDEGPGRAA